jgi:glycosyltransferase involved in cell wall biosynthesis
MHLIYLSHFRFPSEKTHSAFAVKTCEAFAEQGATVELWAPRRVNHAFRDTDIFAYHHSKKNFRIRYLPVIDLMSLWGHHISLAVLVGSYSVSVFFYALFFGLLRRAVFYAHDARDLLLLSLFRPTLVLEIHDFFESGISWISRWVFPKIATFVSTNRLKPPVLVKKFGVASERILVEQNAVDLSLFQTEISQEDARRTLGLPQNTKLVVYTGHLYAWKGVYVLAKAAAFFRDGVALILVGGTVEDQERMQTFLLKEGIATVTVLPHTSHMKIPLYLRAADILALPNTATSQASAVETSPVKLFEYLASGRPIVACDVPAVREIVTEAEVFFSPPDDPAAFAAIVQTVLTAPSSLVEEKQSACRALAAQHTWEKRAERILTFIHRRM